MTNTDSPLHNGKRTLSSIAREIKSKWQNPFYGAKPYIDAMLSIHSSDPDASYYYDDAKTIVAYFLANASTWRGEDARRIKKELKSNYNIK